MNETLRGIDVSRTPIQSPLEPYETHGDVNWVVFNSGKAIINSDKLILFNGVADKSTSTAEISLKRLVKYLLNYGKVENYDPKKGVIIGKPYD